MVKFWVIEKNKSLGLIFGRVTMSFDKEGLIFLRGLQKVRVQSEVKMLEKDIK